MRGRHASWSCVARRSRALRPRPARRNASAAVLRRSTVALACAPRRRLTTAPADAAAHHRRQDTVAARCYGPRELWSSSAAAAQAGVQTRPAVLRPPRQIDVRTSAAKHRATDPSPPAGFAIVAVNDTTAIAQIDARLRRRRCRRLPRAVRRAGRCPPDCRPRGRRRRARFRGPGRVMFGNDEHRSGGAGDFM